MKGSSKGLSLRVVLRLPEGFYEGSRRYFGLATGSRKPPVTILYTL